jgi:hypothetical protein
LALVLLPLVLIPLVLMGGAAYLRARNILEAQARSQLIALTQAQLEVMRQWTRLREQHLQLGSQRADLSTGMDQMMQAAASSPSFIQAQVALRNGLTELLRRGDETAFSDLMFVHIADGDVAVATDPTLEGQVLAPVVDGLVPLDRLQTTAIYNDPLLAPGNLALLTSTPVIPPGGGEPEGLLLGVNRGLRLGALMDEMQILWQSQGIYRVERGRAFLAVAPDVRIGMEEYASIPSAVVDTDHPVSAWRRRRPAAPMSWKFAEGLDEIGAFQWAPEAWVWRSRSRPPTFSVTWSGWRRSPLLDRVCRHPDVRHRGPGHRTDVAAARGSDRVRRPDLARRLGAPGDGRTRRRDRQPGGGLQPHGARLERPVRIARSARG